MRSTQVRLLILVQVIILVCLLLISSTHAGKDDDDDNDGFLETPADVEFKDQKEIKLKCRYSTPIKKCVWRKDGWIVRFKDEIHVRFEYNVSQGLCDIVLRRPKVGVDTSKWKCQVQKMNNRFEDAPEVVIYVKNVPRTTYFENYVSYELMHVSQNPHNQATVHLEMLTDYETRIRWYVDGSLVESLYEEAVDLLKVDSTRVFSSTTVDLSKLAKNEFKIVRCCVEFRAQLKRYKIFTIYLASYNYNGDYRLSLENSSVVPLPYEVTPPKPFLIVDGQQVSDSFLRFAVSYPTLYEVRFLCEDADAFPNSLLYWQVLSNDVDTASDFVEFNKTQQTLEETETISLHAIFKHPQSKVLVACHAFNVLAPRQHHKVAQIHISLEYDAPKCPVVSHKASSSQQQKNNISYFCIIFLFLISKCIKKIL